MERLENIFLASLSDIVSESLSQSSSALLMLEASSTISDVSMSMFLTMPRESSKLADCWLS